MHRTSSAVNDRPSSLISSRSENKFARPVTKVIDGRDDPDISANPHGRMRSAHVL